MDKIENSTKFVGVFDSGLGGLSVLKSMLKILPQEKYIYFGDSANAPYGTKGDSGINRKKSGNVYKHGSQSDCTCLQYGNEYGCKYA